MIHKITTKTTYLRLPFLTYEATKKSSQYLDMWWIVNNATWETNCQLYGFIVIYIHILTKRSQTGYLRFPSIQTITCREVRWGVCNSRRNAPHPVLWWEIQNIHTSSALSVCCMPQLVCCLPPIFTVNQQDKLQNDWKLIWNYSCRCHRLSTTGERHGN